MKARQRRLSLRFLSWFVLGEHIQQETHDSIEDARSALRLYNAFQTFEEQGIFDQKLEELYKEGRQFVSVQPPLIDQHSRESLRKNFKPPTLPGQQTNSVVLEHAPSPLPLQPAQYFSQSTPIFNPYLVQVYSNTRPMAGYPLHRNRNWRR